MNDTLINISRYLFFGSLAAALALFVWGQQGFEANLWATGLTLWLCGPGFLAGGLFSVASMSIPSAKKDISGMYLVLNLGGFTAVFVLISNATQGIF